MIKIKQTIEEKLLNAQQRTKQFANGIAVKFPEESCRSINIKPEITDGEWGGKRLKSVKYVVR